MKCSVEIIKFPAIRILQIRRTRDLRIGSHTDEKLATGLDGRKQQLYSTGITGDGDDHFIE